MSRKMLIDASHPEETRVVVVDGNRVEELDFESAAKRQLRGNVYLARVTRVEPSLQAAFVEYGGNRHGFLAFSEIHPDYYQIPVADRQALIEAEEAEAKAEEERAEKEAERKASSRRRRGGKAASGKRGPIVTKKEDIDEDTDPLRPAASSWNVASKLALSNPDDEVDPTALASTSFREARDLKVTDFDPLQVPNDPEDEEDEIEDEEETPAESTSSDDDADDDEEDVIEQAKLDEARRKRINRRRYKIQEVVKRGQIMLIQVVKEERGNKGAALTTYLSLAGRYCVLMPNTPRGGGISRKISSGNDRKRLKKVLDGLNVPRGMGVIVRTAGAKRSDTQIQRDYDYLAKVWENIRTTTLESTAPSLIHQESDLVKRAIRDMFERDISAVMVSGKQAYEDAKAFVDILMPGQSEKVTEYNDPIPLFLRYQVEKQIEASLEPIAQLKSGGYLVIHPTEALVSVDVNSGRSTKERNVERTALKTNLEAAEEVARQMRLRDLAGLIVIDFIDMDEARNNRAVEKKMKEVLSKDRARVQMGRISQFGLMEISRQRRRRSLLEGSSAPCEHCGGVGRKRSVESSALKAIRAVEEEGVRGRASRIRLNVSPNVALYLFNEKRDLVQAIDKKFNMFTELVSDDTLHRPDFSIERTEMRDTDSDDPVDAIEKEEKNRSKNEQKKSRRKSRRSKSDEDESEDQDQSTSNKPNTPSDDDGDEPKRKRRRRGRRGGRGKRRDNEQSGSEEQSNDTPKEEAVAGLEVITPEQESESAKPKRRRTRRAAPKRDADKGEESKAEASSDEGQAEEMPQSKRRRATRKAPSRSTADDSKPAKRKASAKTEAKKPETEETAEEAKPSRKRVSRKAPSKADEAEAKPKRKRAPKKAEAEPAAETAPDEAKPKTTGRKRVSRKAPAKADTPEEKPASKKEKAKAAEASAPKVTAKEDDPSDDKPKKKRGWFGRRRKAPSRD